ncbi:MAG TPA: heme exporter protein CcmD [Rhodocyclaceae bacterium]|nr:heme exporter protein CcmD [Rhodocyclaceae bacterium]
MTIYWNSLSDFLAMGGYAGYVWGSFGVTALILVLEPLLVAKRKKETIRRLKRLMHAELRRNPTADSVNTSRNSAE